MVEEGGRVGEWGRGEQTTDERVPKTSTVMIVADGGGGSSGDGRRRESALVGREPVGRVVGLGL